MSILRDHGSNESNDFGRGNGTFITAYANIVCVIAGTGTLGLPRAFADGGWLGILILMLAWSMAIYSGVVLIRCLYHKPGQRLSNFKDVGYAAFGWPGYAAASALHFLNLFGCPALTLYWHPKGELTTTIWTCIVGSFLLIPCLVMKTLKEVTAIAAIVVRNGVIWEGFPTALATISFSFGGNNTYPHIEHALGKPQQWKWAIFAGLSTCTCLYILTAVPGYWSYGASTQSPVYLSLPDGAAKKISMIVMTIHFTKVNERFGAVGSWFCRAIIRICTMAILVILAIFVPYFHGFMSLIGALATCGLVFLIPILSYLKLTGFRNKPWFELAFCTLTVFLGIIGCVFGTINAIKGLIKDFQSDA
ncbi:transmembrane amino acid transporter protein-domain-containing protein [Phycomyces blakesleeanus]